MSGRRAWHPPERGRHRRSRWVLRTMGLLFACVSVLAGWLTVAGAPINTEPVNVAGEGDVPIVRPTMPTPPQVLGDGAEEATVPRATTANPTLERPVTPPITPDIPAVGTGQFVVAAGSGQTVGQGLTVTYSVEVEGGLPYDARAIATVVDRVLADERGWTRVADTSLQRVDEEPKFRVRLASPQTVDQLCAPLETRGRLSCRNGESVVLNAWRWANGATAYAENLRQYRTYLINHEFGHALGEKHEECAGVGEIAEVMAQQTKGLDGCRANPWPVEPGS